jgi:hypothetical protein
MAVKIPLRKRVDEKYALKGGFGQLEGILLSNEGASASELEARIALHFGISPGQAHRWLKEYEELPERRWSRSA